MQATAFCVYYKRHKDDPLLCVGVHSDYDNAVIHAVVKSDLTGYPCLFTVRDTSTLTELQQKALSRRQSFENTLKAIK